MPNKIASKKIGQEYEALALEFLLRQGFFLLERNFQIRGAEIDLIMKHHGVIVFVEVKYRKDAAHGHANEMLSYAQSKRIMKAAFLWLKKHAYRIEHTEFRFDLIAISHGSYLPCATINILNRPDLQVEWLQNVITQD